MSTKAGPTSRTMSSFSVVAQVFNRPPVRLRQVRGTSGLAGSVTEPTEELAKLVAVGVGGELRTELDRGGYIL